MVQAVHSKAERDSLRVAEIYPSVQGEGALTGVESTFLRASGCNLRCWYCDTPHASWKPEGDDFAVEEIVAQVVSFGLTHVVVTGGEPMLFSELIPICEQLKNRGCHITIETAGTLFLPLACDLMSISPKMANSTPCLDEHPQWNARHEKTRYKPSVVSQLASEYNYQLKFVIEVDADLAEVEAYLETLPELDRDRVWLMPQATTLEQQKCIETWLESRCKELHVRYCPRRQLEWFDGRRGT